jgi:hypothetical protein
VKSVNIWKTHLYEARKLFIVLSKFNLVFRQKVPVQFEKQMDATGKIFSFTVSHVGGDEYIYVGQDITQRTLLEAELQKVFVTFFLLLSHL